VTVHLIKLCVGIDEVEQLSEIQSARLVAQKSAGIEKPVLRHVTRNMPKRAKEILDGGSLYWVIRRVIQVRQLVVGLEPVERDDGRPACAIILSPQLVRTNPRSFRPFQGWRYFPNADVPIDLAAGTNSPDTLPVEMASELRDLGLL